MADDTVLLRCSDSLLTCQICMERFDSPRILSCQHTFCRACVLSLIRKHCFDDSHCIVSSEFPCPNCRKSCKIITRTTEEDDLLEAFPENLLLKDLLEAEVAAIAELVKSSDGIAGLVEFPQVDNDDRIVGAALSQIPEEECSLSEADDLDDMHQRVHTTSETPHNLEMSSMAFGESVMNSFYKEQIVQADMSRHRRHRTRKKKVRKPCGGTPKKRPPRWAHSREEASKHGQLHVPDVDFRRHVVYQLIAIICLSALGLFIKKFIPDKAAMSGFCWFLILYTTIFLQKSKRGHRYQDC